tara:strand:+ start:720 stop:1832 length:1113 start_codon:yes stop_codon:yes gene_type:complete
MRIAVSIIIGIHGLIHLFGFLKAFGIAEFNSISQPISRNFGVLWLLGFILFTISTIMLLSQLNQWWIIGIIAVLISQFLIINYWSDSKFGTIANVFILLAIIIAYSSFSFKNKIKRERKILYENSKLISQKFVTEEDLADLPPIIQKWLTNSGVIGKQFTSNVHLTQELQLKLNQEQSEWNYGKAEQYFTVQPPAFNWSITTQMNSILSVTGRDKFENGQGEMTIKLFSLIPVANSGNHKKVNQATLQRYLAELVWFPSASLSTYIKWDTLDDNSAKATMEYNGTVGSGEFHFDEKGNFKKFITMRYQDTSAIEPTKWTVVATKIEERIGIKIPTECEASWELENGKWTWLKLKIKEIQYNVKEMPVNND